MGLIYQATAKKLLAASFFRFVENTLGHAETGLNDEHLEKQTEVFRSDKVE